MLEISVTLKQDERGRPTGFRGLGRDVTDRVEAEKALRLSEEHYRTIFENSVVGIFQSTPEGRYIRVNWAFARIYGYESPEEVISSITDIGTQIFVDAEDRKRCLVHPAGNRNPGAVRDPDPTQGRQHHLDSD